jgi:hypothetical protein
MSTERRKDYIVPLAEAGIVFKQETGEDFHRTTILDWATPRDDAKHPGGRRSTLSGARVYLKTYSKMGKRYTTVEWIKQFIASLG